MKTTKHTPGPWIAGIDPGISTSNNKCKVFGAKSPFYVLIEGIEYSEACSNARLIAAAPELLEALERAIEACGGQDEFYHATLALIRRARGET